jgi:hypothetical protein
MPIAQLRIEQTFAKLGLHITKPVQEIEQPPAEMNMRQIPARMEVHTTPPVVLIDQTEARADAGLKSVIRSIAEYAQMGKEAALEAIGRIAREGLQLRAIETGGAGIKVKQIAKQNSAKPMQPAQLTFVPRYGSLKIEGIPGKLEIEWHLGGVESNPVIHKAIHRYTPGKVEGYIAQKNSIRMWVEPQVDMRL